MSDDTQKEIANACIADPHTPMPVLIDCPYEGFLHTKLNSGLLVGLAILVILFMIFVVVPNEPLGATLVLVVLLLFCYVSFRIATRLHLAKVLNPDHGIPTDEAIRQALTPRWFYAGMKPGSVMEEVRVLGRRGVTARVGKSKSLAPIQPIDEIFEPMPLDETDSLFCALDDSGSLQLDGADHPASSFTAEAHGFRQRVKRHLIFSGGIAMVSLVGFVFLMSGIDDLRRGRLSYFSTIWGAYLLMFVFGIGGRGAWRHRQQWLLVPGGVACRSAGFLHPNWRLHLFQRATSVLVVKHTQGQFWAAYVTDDEDETSTGMTQREVEMLLRAWLSPVPTPPLEQLSDLT